MSRRPISQAALNAAPRITPTGYAEEAYQARLRQNRAMPVGPAGLPVPDARAIYRTTIDAPLLSKLVKAALADNRRRELPEAERVRVALALDRELKRRFPPADMLVLERYGFAKPQSDARIDFCAREAGEKPLWIHLPTAVLTPERQAAFAIDLGSRWPLTAPAVPADVEEFCQTEVRLRGEERRLSTAATGFPSQFKVRTGRWPRWLEIEREFPVLHRWLDEQRGISQATEEQTSWGN